MTMTHDERSSTTRAEMANPEPKAGAIDATGWEHFDPGATVVTADGEEVGTVRERMPQYLQVRKKKNLLADEEMYVPRELIDRVEQGTVYLGRTSAELEEMHLTTPPALQEGP
jgi:hypothetical protein